MSIEFKKTHLTRFLDKNGIALERELQEEKQRSGFFAILSTYHRLLADYPDHSEALDRFYRKGQISSDLPADLRSRSKEIQERFQAFYTQFAQTIGKTEGEINTWLIQNEEMMKQMQIAATKGEIKRINGKLNPLYEEWGAFQESDEDEIENKDQNEGKIPRQQNAADPAFQLKLNEIDTEIDRLEKAYAFQCWKWAGLISEKEMRAFLGSNYFSSPDERYD